MANVKCPSCGNEFEGQNSRSTLGFKKYECPKCKDNFITELTSGYKVFYGLLLLLLFGTGISSIIDGGFPIVRGIFIVLIGLIFYKDFSIKKNGGKKIERTGKKWLIGIGIFVLLGVLMFIFQGDPVKFNEEQKKLIGNWKGEGISLMIGEGAYIHYKKEKDNMSSSVSGPITEINENEFKVGIGFINTTFDIVKKPYQDGNLWRMVVDGNELYRVTNRFELEIPNVFELNKLTNDFFILFNNSVFKDNYQILHEGMAKTFQSQINVDELKNALSGLSRAEIDLEKVIENDIVYSKPPFLDENNFLVLEGYYVGEVRLGFVLKYIYEYPNWEIIQFELK